VALFFNLKETNMFTQLDSIINDETSLHLKLSRGANGTLKVCVMPTVSGKNPALAQPLVLAATAAELDEGFVDLIATYQANRVSLSAQVAATTAILGEATRAQSQKAMKAIQTKGKPVAQADDDTGDDGGDDDDSGDTMDTSASTASAPVPAATSSDSDDLLSALMG
jgi:PRTRC genetic system protein E